MNYIDMINIRSLVATYYININEAWYEKLD